MKVIIAWDGDHIGREVGRASLADDVEGLRRISQAIDRGNEIWKAWVVNNGGSMISYGGDEGRAEIPAEHLSELPKIRDEYASAVSATVSVGVGTKLSEADRALMAAKLRGGNHIVLYTEDIDAEVEAATKKQGSEADKLAEEYLTKASPAPAPDAPSPAASASAPAAAPAQPALAEGAGGGMTGASQPGAPSIQAPKLEGSEHSEGEAAQAVADGQGPAPEMTHAAQDLEDQFHGLAQAGQQADQQGAPQENKDAIKLQVVQVLQSLKAQAPVLEQVKQSAPDTYKAVMAMVQVVISMAKEMAGEGQHVSLAQLDASARSNATVMVPQPPEEGEESSGKSDKDGDKKSDKSDTKKSEVLEKTQAVPVIGPEHPKFAEYQDLLKRHDTLKQQMLAPRLTSREKNIMGHSIGVLRASMHKLISGTENMIGQTVPAIPARSKDEHLTGPSPTKVQLPGATVYKRDLPKLQGPSGYVMDKSEPEPKEKKPDDWVDCDERGHTWGSGPTDGACLICGADRKEVEAELDKGTLAEGKAPAQHHHVVLPVGSKIDPGTHGTPDAGKIKVMHPETGKESWVHARAGQVLSQDGHAISSRNPGGK